jgi:hypothetical protein
MPQVSILRPGKAQIRTKLKIGNPAFIDERAFCASAAAFSILLFTETRKLSGFFLKKKPPRTISGHQ